VGISQKDVTEVTICKQTFQIKSGDDPGYVQDLARHVDQCMEELTQRTPTVDTLKIAILAALNIADDLMTTQEKLRDVEREIEESASRILGSFPQKSSQL
jgi:cell division protein ZapA